MKKNILTISLVVLFLIGVLTSGCIGKEKSSKDRVSEEDLVKVVDFLINNKGKEIELVAGEKHRITGKEGIDVVIKMLDCCTKEEFDDLLNSISINGKIKDSNFEEKLIHASVPADEILKIDEIWNVQKIEFEPEARDFWMKVVS